MRGTIGEVEVVSVFEEDEIVSASEESMVWTWLKKMVLICLHQ